MAEKKKTVRLVGRISGTRDGKDWPAPGETIALPEEEANQLLLSGLAVNPDVETATATTAGVETATRGNQPLRQTAATAKAEADAIAAAKAKAEADAQEAAAKLLEEQAAKTKADADAEAKAAAKK